MTIFDIIPESALKSVKWFFHLCIVLLIKSVASHKPRNLNYYLYVCVNVYVHLLIKIKAKYRSHHTICLICSSELGPRLIELMQSKCLALNGVRASCYSFKGN